MSSQEELNIVSEVEEQFGDEIANIKARTAEQLPRMKATFLIENAFLNRSSQSGRKQLTASMVILSSEAGEEFKGKKYSKNWGLETAENWAWLKKDMIALELEPPSDGKSLTRLTQQLPGICFTGSLVPNKDESFPPNCYINKGARRHELEDGSEDAATGSPAEL